jgi:hypothetical protein
LGKLMLVAILQEQDSEHILINHNSCCIAARVPVTDCSMEQAPVGMQLHSLAAHPLCTWFKRDIICALRPQEGRNAAMAHLQQLMATAAPPDLRKQRSPDLPLRRTLIVVDDNQQLRSMRYECCQLARKSELADAICWTG